MPCTMEHRSNEFLQIKQRKINWHPRGCQFGFWTTLTLGAYQKTAFNRKNCQYFHSCADLLFVCGNRQHYNRFLFMGQSYLRLCTGIFVTNVVISFSADNIGSVFNAFILVYVEYIQYDVRFSDNFITQ